MELFNEPIKSQLYFDRYIRLITDILSQELQTGYIEKHHIVPKSMGGSNKQSNIICLTSRQHYLAHWMLWKAFKNKSMTAAFFFLSHKTGNKYQQRYIPSRVFESLRIAHSQNLSARLKGHKQSSETINHRAAMNSGKIRPKEAVKITAEKNTGKKRSDASKLNIKAGQLLIANVRCIHCDIITTPANYAKWHGDKCPILTGISIKTGPRPVSTCPHCGIVGAVALLKRWHFNFCKQAPVNS